MKQIQEIHIENFQSHKKTTIQPAPNGQLTVLTGQSDSGKTAILRALKWVFYNSPANNDFIRVGVNFARVTVGFYDGTAVTRWRSRGGINRYIVDSETLEGFGTGVPLEVIEATGVKELVIGDLSFNLNLSEQLDGPFLGKSISGPARAKVLGKLAGTEEIDYAGKILGTDLYRRNQEEKRVSKELQVIEDSLKEYFYLPEMQKKIIKLEEIVSRVKLFQDKRDRLVQLKNKLQLINNSINDTQKIIKQYENIDLAALMIANAEGSKNIHEQFLRIKVRLFALNEGILQAQKVIKLTKNIETVESTLAIITDKIARRQTLAKLSEDYKVITFAIYDTSRIFENLPDLEQLTQLINKVPELVVKKAKLKEKLFQLANFNSNISTCFQIINKHKNVDEAEQVISLVNSNIQLSNSLSQLLAKLKKVEVCIVQERQSLIILEQQVSELEGAYRDEMLSLGKCPLCGNENINPEKLKEVV